MRGGARANVVFEALPGAVEYLPKCRAGRENASEYRIWRVQLGLRNDSAVVMQVVYVVSQSERFAIHAAAEHFGANGTALADDGSALSARTPRRDTAADNAVRAVAAIKTLGLTPEQEAKMKELGIAL